MLNTSRGFSSIPLAFIISIHRPSLLSHLPSFLSFSLSLPPCSLLPRLRQRRTIHYKARCGIWPTHNYTQRAGVIRPHRAKLTQNLPRRRPANHLFVSRKKRRRRRRRRRKRRKRKRRRRRSASKHNSFSSRGLMRTCEKSKAVFAFDDVFNEFIKTRS
ncbi:hypothetical protein E2C01_056309 [Portunus trituberculatus]|uniref:Uncharacterized protein n=1 Tax=Portunus trituberculatus TaxID=210409 RepID=A0A5B7GXB9_PORTR|nr:hypothetical protein [Portunus trituberculatus]